MKDDGLAAGKGVVVTADRDEALAHAAACGRVVVEEFLDGPEVSLFCVTDGVTVLPLLPAQDFKRLGDGDTGPNTGGMGAYAPLPWLPAGLVDEVVRDASPSRPSPSWPGAAPRSPACSTSGWRSPPAARGSSSSTPASATPRPRSCSPCSRRRWAACSPPPGRGELAAHPPLRWHPGAAVTVVLAAAGYPGTPRAGDVVTGSEQPGVVHAGTRRRDDGAIVASGGRVLSATAVGDIVGCGAGRRLRPGGPHRPARRAVPHRHRRPSDRRHHRRPGLTRDVPIRTRSGDDATCIPAAPLLPWPGAIGS